MIMATCSVKVLRGDTEHEVRCEQGTTILEALEREDREQIDTPCGGRGVCGKCLVKVEGGGVSETAEVERKKLSEIELGQGYRLACVTEVRGDITVTIPSAASHIEILEKGVDFVGELEPCVQKKHVTLKEPDLEDQRDDLTRLKDALSIPNHTAGFSQLKELPSVLRKNGFSVTGVYNDFNLIAFEPGNTENSNYGIAVDIGTTTVVVYLMDLNNGKKVGVASGLNVQKAYGQDVISRINHAMTNENGLETLRTGIVDQLNSLISSLSEKHDIPLSNMYSMTVAGNTTMMHLFTGLPPENIAAAPFIPAALEPMQVRAEELGVRIAESGRAYLIPGISAYIGADITAATLAGRLLESDKLGLLIDIGTNGEIMLGDRNGLIACSTAAGPAFEGATIRDGVGGIAGAINVVTMGEESLHYTTIAEGKPIGICGSGIVDTISTLLYFGIIDKTGRMQEPDEIENGIGKKLAKNLAEEKGQAAFKLVDASKTSHGDTILLTQRDVREIQNAKASIAAGINTLIKEAGKEVTDIDTVYLAGGFGSYIDKHHAVHLGIIPEALENRIRVIGNAAGSGAIMALLSKEHYKNCKEIAAKTKYVELSSSPAFMDDYINSMVF
jgi:uncharacterized 2Fe-2S/4Fe-4S cluster protein (DUF4445 family)